jgi:hypothetical protein
MLITVSVAKTATSKRFVDHGNGTVTDTKSGLMWVKNPLEVFPDKMRWKVASGKCRALNLQGVSGWRVPSKEELLSLLDLTQPGGLPKNHPFIGVQAGDYWSSTLQTDDPKYGWYVDFLQGNVKTRDVMMPTYVWPVRNV